MNNDLIVNNIITGFQNENKITTLEGNYKSRVCDPNDETQSILCDIAFTPDKIKIGEKLSNVYINGKLYIEKDDKLVLLMNIIKELENKIKKMEEDITELQYAPNGPVYHKAKLHFENSGVILENNKLDL